jgi:heme/copper-type cytochrome/quinol oxidase subunit 4
MTKKRNKEEEFLKKSSKMLKILCVLVGFVLGIIYCIDGGFYSLLFDLRESKTIIIYSIVIIVLLCLLVILNVSDEPSDKNNKKWETSSYVTVGIIILIIIFGLLFIFTLIDFFLPIIALTLFLIITYYLVNRLIKTLVNKYGIK